MDITPALDSFDLHPELKNGTFIHYDCTSFYL